MMEYRYSSLLLNLLPKQTTLILTTFTDAAHRFGLWIEDGKSNVTVTALRPNQFQVVRYLCDSYPRPCSPKELLPRLGRTKKFRHPRTGHVHILMNECRAVLHKHGLGILYDEQTKKYVLCAEIEERYLSSSIGN